MKAVLLAAYGTPRTLEEVDAYYTHIRGGRRPSSAELENLVERYRSIGGTSPLIRITEGQRSGLESRLRSSGSQTRVRSGMKHSPPFIGEVVRRVASEGVDELLAIALAPHYSILSVGSYMRTVDEAASPLGLRLELVRSWHDRPELIGAWRERVVEARKRMTGEDPWIVFTAHSLPERILSEGDPYRDQLMTTARLVAESVGTRRWSFAFQSASRTGEPWLGPDVLEHLNSLHLRGERSFLIAPIGFVSDHLEILYDIDVECRRWAAERGAELERCDSLNDCEGLIGCLAGLVGERGFL